MKKTLIYMTLSLMMIGSAQANVCKINSYVLKSGDIAPLVGMTKLLMVGSGEGIKVKHKLRMVSVNYALANVKSNVSALQSFKSKLEAQGCTSFEVTESGIFDIPELDAVFIK